MLSSQLSWWFSAQISSFACNQGNNVSTFFNLNWRCRIVVSGKSRLKRHRPNETRENNLLSFWCTFKERRGSESKQNQRRDTVIKRCVTLYCSRLSTIAAHTAELPFIRWVFLHYVDMSAWMNWFCARIHRNSIYLMVFYELGVRMTWFRSWHKKRWCCLAPTATLIAIKISRAVLRWEKVVILCNLW